jgi:hypothetical protein
VFSEFSDLDLADARYKRQVIIGVTLGVATFLPATHFTIGFGIRVDVDSLVQLDGLFEACLDPPTVGGEIGDPKGLGLIFRPGRDYVQQLRRQPLRVAEQVAVQA